MLHLKNDTLARGALSAAHDLLDRVQSPLGAHCRHSLANTPAFSGKQSAKSCKRVSCTSAFRNPGCELLLAREVRKGKKSDSGSTACSHFPAFSYKRTYSGFQCFWWNPVSLGPRGGASRGSACQPVFIEESSGALPRCLLLGALAIFGRVLV